MGFFEKLLAIFKPQKQPEKQTLTEQSSSGNKDNTKGRLLYEKLNDYTVIDLETSSKYANQANIIELAAVKVRKGRISGQYSTLIKPPEPISDEVVVITGITNEMLAAAPDISAKLKEFLQFIGNDVILGHNIRAYDVNVINYACKSLGIPPLMNDMVDTLHYAKKCEISVYNYRLPTLTRYFHIQHDAHRALNDCIANHYVYEKLKQTYNGVFHKPLDRTAQSKENMRICTINPAYDITGKSIVLTGDFEIAEVDDIQEKLESLGAVMKRDVSGKTDYLIIGNLGHRQWYYGSYGRKIEKAIELQGQGKPIKMIEEDQFFVYKKA